MALIIHIYMPSAKVKIETLFAAIIVSAKSLVFISLAKKWKQEKLH